MTKDQLDAWESFTAPEWQPFKAAWLGRGLLWPPSGEPDGDDTSQRGLLWQIADARPNDLGQWITDAPKGSSVREIIDYALEGWHTVRVDAGVEDLEWLQEKAEERRAAAGAMTRLKDLL